MKKILLLALLLAVAAVFTAAGEGAPEWADVSLNERGFLDEGAYVLEDPDNGHWMYVNETLRIQIVRSWETPEKIRKLQPAESLKKKPVLRPESLPSLVQ